MPTTELATTWQPTIAEYHADPAISHSSLELFRRDPALFHGVRTGRFPRNVTAAMEESSLLHTALLEPERFAAESVEVPADVLTTDGKRFGNKWKAFKEENEGKLFLSAKERQQIAGMADSIQSHQPAYRLLYALNGNVEHSVKWTDADTGLELRARFDKIMPHLGLICDLKTVLSSKREAFAAEAERLGYHRQAALYCEAARMLELIEDPAFTFITVEKEPPYSVEVYELEPSWVMAAHEENHADLRGVVECQTSGRWTTKTHGQIVTLSRPRWAKDWSYSYASD